MTWASNANIAKYSVVLPFDFDFCVQNMISANAKVALDANVAAYNDDEYFDNNHMKQIKATTSNYRAACFERFEVTYRFL